MCRFWLKGDLCADLGKGISVSLVIAITFQGIAFGTVLPDLHRTPNHLGERQHNRAQAQQEAQHLCWLEQMTAGNICSDYIGR